MMVTTGRSTFLLTILVCWSALTHTLVVESAVQGGKIGVPVVADVSQGDPAVNSILYTFTQDYQRQEVEAVVVSTSTEDGTSEHPVSVSVVQVRSITSWTIPYIMRDSTKIEHKYDKVSRALCFSKITSPLPIDGGESGRVMRSFRVDLSSVNSTALSPTVGSRTNVVHVTVNTTLLGRAHNETNSTRSYDPLRTSNAVYEVKNGTLYRFNIAPAGPHHYIYEFSGDSVIMKFQSPDKTCMVIVIIDKNCPSYMIYGKFIQKDGIRQTMTRQAAVVIQKEEFASCRNADTCNLSILLMVQPSDHMCSEKTSHNVNATEDERIKVVELLVERPVTCGIYIMAISTPVSAYIFIWIISCICLSCIYCRSHQDNVEERGVIINQGEDNVEERGVIINQGEQNVNDDREERRLPRIGQLPESSILKQKFDQYKWYIGIVAVFYALPVIQLVYFYNQVFRSTGNEDSCYFNFYCTRALGTLTAFNNIFSNIGYVMLGILFIVIVIVRDCKDVIGHIPGDNRLPNYYGVHYALGIGLIMEGVLSGSYHVCPTTTNFQFDTSFMFMMMGLSMIRLYQNRHYHRTANAHVTYAWFGFLILITVLGMIDGRLWVWLVFLFIDLLFAAYLTLKLITYGQFELLNAARRNIVEMLSENRVPKKTCIVLLIANLVNFVFIVTCTIKRPFDFAFYILLMMVISTLFYFLYYLIMKHINKERSNWAVVSGVVSLVHWIPALVLFKGYPVYKTELLPAESREYNRECFFLNFYDQHDVWHFLSAIALFFSFIMLLLVDDDRKGKTDVDEF